MLTNWETTLGGSVAIVCGVVLLIFGKSDTTTITTALGLIGLGGGLFRAADANKGNPS